jgi:hypothetical protein
LNLQYTLVVRKFLSDEDCDFLIKTYNKNNKVIEDSCGYIACPINNINLNNKLNNIVKLYTDKFPEIYYTKDKWFLNEVRVKHFKPKKYFKSWHSEHGIESPLRILVVQIYLSNHNCGTKFFNGETIKSEKGKLAVWPAYFTHTHKGEPCPDNKDRYLLSGYYSFNLNL